MTKLSATLFAITTGVAICATAQLKITKLDELKKGLAAKTLTVVDANTDQVRTETGYIPGAILQDTKSSTATKDLPADKKTPLVFYCYNQQCMASHGAAKAAAKKGYQHVSVFSDGIDGWVKAGEPVEKLTATK